MRPVHFFAACLLMIAVPVWRAHPAAAKDYTCAMHPQVHESQPGTCPICGMDLIPQTSGPPPSGLPALSLGCDSVSSCRTKVADLCALVKAAARGPDPHLRSLAAPALDSRDLRTRLLKDPDGMVRQAAAYQLGHRGDRASLAALKRASFDGRADPQGLARTAALHARLQLGDTSAADGLRSWMANPDPAARLVAVGWASLHPALEETVRTVARKDASEQIRDIAWLGLAYLGDRRAVERIAGRWDQRTYRTHAKLDPRGSRKRLMAVLEKARRPPTDPARRAPWFIDTATAAVALLETGAPAGREALHRLLAQSEGHTHLSLAVLLQLRTVAAPADLPAVAKWVAAGDPATRVVAATICLAAMSHPGCRLEAN